MIVGKSLLSVMLLVCWVSGVAAAQTPTVVARSEKDSPNGITNLRLLHPSKQELLAFYALEPKVFITLSSDGGESWKDLAGKPGASPVTDVGRRGGFDVCIDDDVVYLAFTTRSSVKVQTFKRTDKTWSASEAKTLDRGIAMTGPTICKDASGDVWVAYYFGGHDAMTGIRVSRTPTGERFGENTGRFNVAYGFGSTVQKLVVWRGRPVLFYSGGSNHESRQIYWTAFDGKRWPRPAVGVGECARSPGTFAVTVDDHDVLHVAWRSSVGRFARIWYRRCDASGKWSDVATSLHVGQIRHCSAPRLLTDGVTTWCVWSHPGKGELAYRVLKNGAWIPEPRVVGVEPLGRSLTTSGRIPPDANAIPVVFPRLTTAPKAPAKEVLLKSVKVGDETRRPR